MSVAELTGGQADILEVIADLSNDEVFTPPRVANAVLDLLPAEVWEDPSLRWLDPGTKTGVFLREATKRLLGNEKFLSHFADEESALEHILRNMMFGLPITELTSWMSRRTLYCSRNAAGPNSAVALATPLGNMWFRTTNHRFASGRCVECGAGESLFGASAEENYAYSFIHEEAMTSWRKEVPLKFDVIVGNPPYQMADGGPGGSASPLYNEFVMQAIAMNPRYLTMVIPSRWFVGGKGLSGFRAAMLQDRRLRKLVDYQDARSLFPSINLNGGVNYFLWDRDYEGPCEVTSVHSGGRSSTTARDLGKYDVMIRLNEAVSILDKVQSKKELTIDPLVSTLRPFGFRTFFSGKSRKPAKDAVLLYQNGGTGWVSANDIEQNTGWIEQWKVLITAASDGNENYPLPVLTEPIVAGPGTACTETYLMVGPFASQSEAENVAAYMKTRFFRFLLSLRKHAQHNSREKFAFIPSLDWNVQWDDEQLYARYGISDDEAAFIAEQIREWSS